MLLERTPLALTKLWPEAPYKGLNYYTAADAPLFAQRDNETETCTQIVGSYEAKILLLHGRSGTGKSSFLRSGLLPRLLQNNQFACLHTICNPSEPYLIRCTDDPILRLHSSLVAALESDATFSQIDQKIRTDAISLLKSTTGRPALTKALMSCLTLITSHLVGTLVLVIDQSEEVLTLASDDESTSKKENFFSFLEDLCFERIDLKVIVCLRTEYYGQFCDWFSVLPSLAITTRKVGMEQFMLHGLRDKDDLIAAIERPTLKRKIGEYEPPYNKYGFEYDTGLVEKIAVDIVDHCGESSALPVMQVVCKDLYETVVINGSRNLIQASDYAKQGKVEGALDRFIDQSIRSAVHSVSRRPSNDAVESWRDVIATLVARQEGGALTTTLSPKEELLACARTKGFKSQAEDCLTMMADKKYRLLRKISLVSAEHSSTEYFSLGHDAVAASLFRWKEARDKLLEAKTRLRRVRIFSALIILAVVLGALGAYGQILLMRRASVKATDAYAASEPHLDARIRLLLLLASWRESSGLAWALLPFEETRTEIEKTLLLSPTDMQAADAFGISPDGNMISFIRNNKIYVQNLNGSERPKEIGPVGSPEVPPDRTDIAPRTSIGFVSGLSNPVAFKDGQFTFWIPDGTKRVVRLRNLPGYEKLQRPFVDISGAAIRVTVPDQNVKLSFFDLQFDAKTNSLVPNGHNEIVNYGSIWPTYSEFSDELVVIKNLDEGKSANSLSLQTRTTPSRQACVQLPGVSAASGTEQAVSSSSNDRYLRSLTFSNKDQAIVVRENASTLLLFLLKDGEFQKPLSIAIPEDAAKQTLPKPAFFTHRPLLAAVHVGEDWLVAFLTQRGIASIRIEMGDRPPLLRSPPLLPSITSLDSAAKLRFSDDGKRLFLLQQRGPGQANLHIWDLNESRKQLISRMSSSELRKEACRIADLEEPGKYLTSDEQASWQDIINGTQPCEGIE